jgi:hypothetical protein
MKKTAVTKAMMWDNDAERSGGKSPDLPKAIQTALST